MQVACGVVGGGEARLRVGVRVRVWLSTIRIFFIDIRRRSDMNELESSY